jgi:hypothetical protein
MNFNIEHIRTEKSVAFYSVLSEEFEAIVLVENDATNPYIHQVQPVKGVGKLNSFSFVSSLKNEVLTFNANRK